MKTMTRSLLFLISFCAGTVFAAPGRDQQQADKLFAAKQYRQAIASYEKALAVSPQPANAGDIHVRMGDAWFRLNDYHRALASYRNAARDPRLADKAQTQYWIGFCCFLVGRDAEAVDELLKVPNLYPDAAAWGTTSYYWAGRASERMGKKEQAAEYYRRAGGNGKSTQGKFAKKREASVNSK